MTAVDIGAMLNADLPRDQAEKAGGSYFIRDSAYMYLSSLCSTFNCRAPQWGIGDTSYLACISSVLHYVEISLKYYLIINILLIVFI